MNLIGEEDYKRFNLARLIAIALVVLAPIVYLVLAQTMVSDSFQAEEQALLLMYLLLPIAVVDPLLWYLIRRVQLPVYRNREKELGRAKLYVSLTNIKLSLVAAIFVYGLVSFFLTNEIKNMLWFYLIGATWAVIFWPRKSHFERVMNDGLEAM